MIVDGHKFFNKLCDFVKIQLDTSQIRADSYLSILPNDFLTCYAVKGCGVKALNASLKKQELLSLEITQKFKLKNLTQEEATKIYLPLILQFPKLKIPNCDGVGLLANTLNEAIQWGDVDFRFSSKIILSFLAKEKLITITADEDTRDFFYDKGPKYDLCPIKFEYIDGYISSRKKIIFDEKLNNFVKKNLFNIFYLYYGKNILNVIKTSNEVNIDLEDKKRILIFDLDATVFDTDFLRKQRLLYGCKSINDAQLDNVNFIKNFDKIFLDSTSEYYLYSNEVYFLTSSSSSYANKLIKKHNIKTGILYPSCGNYKSEILKKIKDNNQNDLEIIAFGDDEKDVFLYENAEIPYILVKNDVGYDLSTNLSLQVIKPDVNSFRQTFMYDVIPLNKGQISGFTSKYFDDIIVYYRRYYDKYDSGGHTPTMPLRFQYSKLTYTNFGSNKYEGALNFKDAFLSIDYKDLIPSKDIIITKVPGSKETIRNLTPMTYILDGFLNKGFKVREGLLLRRYVVEQNHGNSSANRSIEKHLDSIYCTRQLHGETVYLFDDIVTSGASMVACVEKLYNNGAGHVVCFCLARTCPSFGFKLHELEGKQR